MAYDDAMARRAAEARLDDARARELLARLQQDGARVAARFGLVYRAIVAERPSAGHYGVCFEDGLIKIRLQHAVRGTPLKYSSLVHTLCHELAHLRHFDHGDGFRRFLRQLLDWAREVRIYRPGRAAPRPPEVEDCGIDPEDRRRFLEQMRRAVERARTIPPPDPWA